jgi:cytochrome P450
VSPVFSAESLNANESRIINVIERFCDTIKPITTGWGQKWNAAEMSTYLGFDIMGALVFGCDFRAVQEEKNRGLANSVLPATMVMYWVWKFMLEHLYRNWCFWQISYLPIAFLVRPLLRTSLFERLGGKSVADNNRLIDYSHDQAKTRISLSDTEKQAEDGRMDFMARLVDAEDKKTSKSPTLADLGAEGLNLINAGADPYSGVMAGAFFYLTHNPNALQKATQEIR